MTEFHHIRLEMARAPDAPTGDPGEGYDMVAPLDSDGRLDAAGWRAEPERAYARRFSDGVTEAKGQLRLDGRDQWTIDLPGEAEDAVGYRFGHERFVVGEYVSLTLPSGEQNTYQVVVSRPLDA